MVFYEILDPAKIRNKPNGTACQVPPFVTVMLQNVYLDHSKTTPPIGHRGDFWHWMLTDYGMALMHALVRASGSGFSYSETFMEAEPGVFPQLVLLEMLNTVIQSQLTPTASPPDWTPVFERSQFLHSQHILISPAIFQREIEHLIMQVRQGRYDQSGSQAYAPPGSKRLGLRNMN